MKEFKNAPKALSEFLPSDCLTQTTTNLVARRLVADSRDIQVGDLFCAIKGLTVDAAQFVDMALEQGAVAALVDSQSELTFSEDKPVLRVADLAHRLSDIASKYFDEPSKALHMVGVTGTNGKSSCAQLLADCLSQLGQKTAMLGTLGYGFVQADEPEMTMAQTNMTTPDALSTQAILADLLEQNAQSVVMEVSSHALDQSRVAAVDFNTAIFTNLSHDHLDYHQTMEAYGLAKAKLFEMPSVDTVIINQDDDFGKTLIQKQIDAGLTKKVITFSLESHKSFFAETASVHFSLVNLESTAEGQRFTLLLTESSQQQTVECRTQLLGKFNLSNLLAVVAAAWAENHRLNDLAAVIERLKPVKGRLETVENKAGITVVVDFAHTPDALEKTLQTLKELNAKTVWCVFGCGGDRDRAKRPAMAKVAEAWADNIVVTSDNPRSENPLKIIQDIESGFSEKANYQAIENRSDSIRYAISKAEAGDCVLIAGKGHETYQQIGTEKIFFSDQYEAREALALRSAGVVSC